jgi:hypothetical protein
VAKYLLDFRFKVQRRWVGSLGLSCDAEFGESMEVQDLKKRFDRREKYVCELVFPDFLDVFELGSPELGDIKVCREERAIDSCRSG